VFVHQVGTYVTYLERHVKTHGRLLHSAVNDSVSLRTVIRSLGSSGRALVTVKESAHVL
jgi:hypothetical protein